MPEPEFDPVPEGGYGFCACVDVESAVGAGFVVVLSAKKKIIKVMSNPENAKLKTHKKQRGK